MTRSKNQIIKYFIFLMIFLLAQSAVCNGSPSVNRDAPALTLIKNNTVNETAKKINAHIPLDGQKYEQQITVLPEGTIVPGDNKTANNITSKLLNVNTTELQKKQHVGEKHATLNAGALKRGFYVFVGLSVLVIAYMVFRRFRLSKTRAQMVRKYGVLAHRQDVEMRPLPLDEEDDEDTTVFDASNVMTNNVQH